MTRSLTRLGARCLGLVLPAFVGLAAVACGGGDIGPGGAEPAAIEIVDGEDQVGAAGDALARPVVARVTDAEGQPVEGAAVAFNDEADGDFATAAPTTDADGEATAVWTLGSHAGAVQATVTVEGVAPVLVSATAVAGPVDAGGSTVSAEPASVALGGTATVTVAARDAFGNPIAGAVVELSAVGAGVTLVQPPATDDAGTAVGSLQADEPGTKTVTAIVAGVVLDQTAAVEVEGPPSVATVEVTPDEAGLLVGQTIALTAAALDAGGQPVPGAEITWSTDDAGVAEVDLAGNVTAVSPGTAVITAGSGGHSGTATLTVSLGEGTLTGVTYCTIDGVADLMDVYLPSATKPRPLPVAVHVHGGGWVSGSRSTGERFAALKDELLDRGYMVASLDYRLGPAHKYPAQIQDVKCAIRHLRARASRYGLDADRIGAWGGSAGGQLVALLGTADASAGFDDAGGFPAFSSEVQAVAAISAITDFTATGELFDDYSRAFQTWPDPTSPEMIEASPVTHVSAGDSPFFFLVGDEDALVAPAQSERMDQRLRQAGVESSLLRVLHADHDLSPTSEPTDPSQAAIVNRIADFFDAHLH